MSEIEHDVIRLQERVAALRENFDRSAASQGKRIGALEGKVDELAKLSAGVKLAAVIGGAILGVLLKVLADRLF